MSSSFSDAAVGLLRTIRRLRDREGRLVSGSQNAAEALKAPIKRFGPPLEKPQAAGVHLFRKPANRLHGAYC